MAFPVDTQIVVASSDDDGFNLLIGPEGLRLEQAELVTMMSGEIDMTQYLKFNIAVGLKLAGVDPNDAVAVKSYLDSTTFKYFR